MSVRSLLDLRVSELLDELRADAPVPGVGAAAAVVVAMAAAVVAKAARRSTEWAESRAVAAQADSLGRRAAALAQEGAETYGRVLRLREEPANAAPPQRDFQLGRAFSEAADAPLRTAELAEDVAELAAVVAENGDQAQRADAAGAATLAAAAATVAAELVAINLVVTEDDPRPAQARSAADGARRAATRTTGAP